MPLDITAVLMWVLAVLFVAVGGGISSLASGVGVMEMLGVIVICGSLLLILVLYTWAVFFDS